MKLFNYQKDKLKKYTLIYISELETRSLHVDSLMKSFTLGRFQIFSRYGKPWNSI